MVFNVVKFLLPTFTIQKNNISFQRNQFFLKNNKLKLIKQSLWYFNTSI
jgi:hypothetical protein